MDAENDDGKMWDWKVEDFSLPNDVDLEIPPSLWDETIQNEVENPYVFHESTPVRACGDMSYHTSDNGNMSKEIQQSKEASSQAKRRRMLQFDDDEPLQNPFREEENPSVFLKSKERMDSLEDAMFDMSQWVSGFADDASLFDHEALDQSSEGWLADCLNDAEIYSPDDTNLSGASDIQTDYSESSYKPPEYEAPVAQVRHAPRTRQIVVSKGTKSYMKTPTKPASSVVYPFDFIKPCAAQGDLTLQDINQRIRTPRKLREEYPTSAFSGKPVVEKTKIRTEGGKGSITIMRTKG